MVSAPIDLDVKGSLNMHLDGVRKIVPFMGGSNKISRLKQMNSLAPNIIHSLDASHLRLVATN